MIGIACRRALASAVVAASLVFPLLSAPGVQRFEVGSDAKGDGITVRASAEVQAAPRTVLGVITDYDHLARFIPYIRISRVVQRDEQRVVVEQAGDLDFVFFKQSVVVTLSVIEPEPGRVAARAIGGNLKEMEGLYVVESLPSGYTRLSYSGRIVPGFSVPPVIGKIAMRRVMERQFEAMVSEIQAREHDRARPP